MKRFVFDFETMGQDPDAVVLSCALTFFDDEMKSFQDYVNQTYYWKFEIEHQIQQYKRDINSQTLEWWDKQDPEVKKAQFEPTDEDISLVDFIVDLKMAMVENEANNKTLGYVRGQSFDFPILTHITKQVMGEIDSFKINPAFFPIPFWNQRDIRSYIAGLLMSPESTKFPVPKGVLDGFEHHNPIHDNARAIMMIQFAEAYANGDMEVPDEEDWDENSMK